MRGEQTIKQGQQARREGSPPLARGTVFLRTYYNCGAGITPACAGNSHLCLFAKNVEGDHPRLRGEQPNPLMIDALVQGSPPLARGTVLKANKFSRKLRITPACAGNSNSKTVKQRLNRDHPRLRGEQVPQCTCEAVPKGSPPLARGTD